MARSRAGSQRRLAAIARRQHRLFTLEQAVACGYTHDFVWRRVRDHRWKEVEPHVYRATLAGTPTWQETLLAVVLTTNGVAGGRSAAALFGLLPPPNVPEVVIDHRIRSARHRRPGVRAVRDLTERDVVEVDGIPSTSVARSLVDLASSLGEGRVTDLVDTAIVRRLVTARRLAEAATKLWAPRRNGCAVVLRVLQTAHPELWRARNEWEARVLRHLSRLGVPDPIPNLPVHVGGRRRVIDFAWPEIKVALEFDGFVPHSNRRTFDDDRARQNDLVDDNWRVYRVTSSALRRSARGALAPVVRAVLA